METIVASIPAVPKIVAISIDENDCVALTVNKEDWPQLSLSSLRVDLNSEVSLEEIEVVEVVNNPKQIVITFMDVDFERDELYSAYDFLGAVLMYQLKAPNIRKMCDAIGNSLRNSMDGRQETLELDVTSDGLDIITNGSYVTLDIIDLYSHFALNRLPTFTYDKEQGEGTSIVAESYPLDTKQISKWLAQHNLDIQKEKQKAGIEQVVCAFLSHELVDGTLVFKYIQGSLVGKVSYTPVPAYVVSYLAEVCVLPRVSFTEYEGGVTFSVETSDGLPDYVSHLPSITVPALILAGKI